MGRVTRRAFLRALAAGTVVAAAGPLAYAAAEPFTISVEELEIPLPGLAPGLSGLRAVQISDLHMGGFTTRAQLAQVLQKVIALQPDLVLNTGDYLTSNGDRSLALDELEEAFSQYGDYGAPVFSVLGNHDHARRGKPLRELLERHGIIDLENTYMPFDRNGERIYIGGVGSLSTGNYDLRRLLAQLPGDAPVIVLGHEPDTADYSAESGAIALQLSGHSHGGQINLPLLGRPILPWMGRKYPIGLYQIAGMWQYTNRGIGTTAVPLRLNCPPEITVFTFVPA
jgi:predicted MPP superfamily phosphohydrolase